MAATVEDFSPFRSRTANLPPAHRLPTWREEWHEEWHEECDHFTARRLLSFQSDRPCRFNITVRNGANGDMSAKPAGEAAIQHMTLSGQLWAERTRALLADGNDDVVLHIHQRGYRMVSQLGRDAFVEPGTAILTSNADVSRMDLPGPARFVNIGLPRRPMASLVPRLEDTLVKPLPAYGGILRLLLRYLDLLDEEMVLKSPDLRRAVVTHVHDLCALAIGAARDAVETAAGRGLRAARLRVLKADIARTFQEGDVSAEALARRHHISPRYIYKLFERDGTTLSQFVADLRLARVYRMLGDLRYAGMTIGALAYSVGFTDLSTFNRAFRRRYGIAPTDVRAVKQGAQSPHDRSGPSEAERRRR